MNKEEKNELSHPSTLEERTPLLGGKKAVNLYTEVITPGKHTDVAEPACEPGPAAAGTSRTGENGEASSAAADSAVLDAEILKKYADNKEEMAELISTYEAMADVVSPAFGCGLCYGIWLCVCYCLSTFMIQFPMHVLLLSLPISIGFMGARYMTQCPMNTKLPYAMMVIGGLGVLVLLVRLALLLHTKFSNDERLKKWLTKGTKVLECVFLLSLICEICFSYEKSPSDDPLSPNYCDTSFYSFVSSINNVLIALVFVWIFLYFITGQRCMRRTVPP